MMLVAYGGEDMEDNSKLQITEGKLGSKDCWWYLELADTTKPLQTADLGIAPKACDC
jgi:hypothetical protein